MSNPTSRRSFLSGRSVLKVLDEIASAPLPPTSSAPAGIASQSSAGSHSPGANAVRQPERPLLTNFSREAMACEFEIVLSLRDYPQAADAAVDALDLVDTLEGQLTVYRETSEVSQLNREANSRAVPVEAGLFRLLARGLELFAATQGAVDITAGALSKVWGFYRRQGRMPSQAEVAESLAKVGSQHLQLDEAEQTVRLLKPGMELNLGAIGKGFALDSAAECLLTAGVNDFLIHGGMSSVLAVGGREILPAEPESAESDPSAEKAALGWWVGLRHPLKPEVRLAEMCLRNQALGTSGSGTQFFHYQGKRYGHILDPRTGWPAEQVLSATVIAPTATESDALSTALYVLGLEQAVEFCQRHPQMKALLVTAGARGGEIELHPLNLASEDWRQV